MRHRRLARALRLGLIDKTTARQTTYARGEIGLFRRRRFRKSGQHPDFPFPILFDIRGRPEVRAVDRSATLVLARVVALARSNGSIRSQGPKLIGLNLCMIETCFKHSFEEFSYIRLQSTRSNDDSIGREV